MEYDGTILYKVAVEYDIIEGNFTGEKYFEIDVHNGYVPVAQFKLPKFCEVKVAPMSPPKVTCFILTLNGTLNQTIRNNMNNENF